MLAELIKKQIAHKLSKGQDVSSDLDRASFLYFRGLLTDQEMEEIMTLIPQEEEAPTEPEQVIEEEVPEEEVVEEGIVEDVQPQPMEEEVQQEEEVIIVEPQQTEGVEE